MCLTQIVSFVFLNANLLTTVHELFPFSKVHKYIFTLDLITLFFFHLIVRSSTNFIIDGTLPDETVPGSGSNIFVSVESMC